jgi:hypothetical protein
MIVSLPSPGCTAPDFIRGKPLFHPQLVRTFERALEAIRLRHKRFVMIIGPAANGKTFLLSELGRRIFANHVPDDRYLPAIAVEVEKSSDRPNWGALTLDLQKALRPDLRAVRDLHDGRINVRDGIIARRTEVTLLDELHHLVPNTMLRNFSRECGESMKSLVRHVPGKFVGFGTYLLLELTDKDDQIAHRTKRIHFPRYNLAIEADVRDFKLILEWIELESRSILDISLSGQWQNMYAGSLGRVGLLRSWLGDAFGKSLDRGLPGITQETLDAARTDPLELETMNKTIEAGEKRMRDLEDRLGQEG